MSHEERTGGETQVALACIMRMHAADPHSGTPAQCTICHVAWPCPTWIVAAGETG